MKKNLLKTMVALAFMALGTANVSAQTETGTALVKMTYISGGDNADTAYGEIPDGEPAYTGYNKISGGKVELANAGWGVNNAAILQVDASCIPGVITKATLTADFQQIGARGMAYGVGYNDSEWSSELTWNTADRSITLMGATQGTSKATNDVELSFDITDAMKYDKGYIATILVYNTAAGAGYLKNPEVEVEYEPYEATSTTFTFEDDNKVFTDDSRITSAIEDNTVLGSKVLGWTCAHNAQNGYCFSHYDFTSLLDKPALVKVEFDYYNTKGGRAIITIGDALVRGTTGGSDKVKYNNTGAIFRIGSEKETALINGITLLQDDKTTTTTVTDPDTEEPIEVESTEPGLCNKWLHVTVIVNNDAKTVAWVVTDQDEELIHTGSGKFYANDANECTQIDLFGYINDSHCAMIDNLEITNYKSNATFADYTIKYVDANGNEIKEARTGNGQVGKGIVLIDSDKAAITVDGVKYLYDTDDSESVVIAESGTVVTVTFREALKYYIALTLRTTDNVQLARMMGDDLWFWEDEVGRVYPARGMLSNGKYYFVPATSYNGFTVTLNPSVIIPQYNKAADKWYIMNTITDYALVDSVAYYSDFERLALPTTDEGNGTGLGQLSGTVNSWYSFSGGYFERFSGARGIRLDAGSYVWTEPIAEAGTYKVTIYGRNDKSMNCPAPYVLGYKLGDDYYTYTELTIPDWGSATTGANIVENVAIPAGASLLIMNDGSVLEDGSAKMISLDDISLTKTGEFVEPVTVGINNVVTAAQQSNVLYNLAGQAVKNATKGIYIKNGKKVVIK